MHIRHGHTFFRSKLARVTSSGQVLVSRFPWPKLELDLATLQMHGLAPGTKSLLNCGR
jgi:hypothetical protein